MIHNITHKTRISRSLVKNTAYDLYTLAPNQVVKYKNAVSPYLIKLKTNGNMDNFNKDNRRLVAKLVDKYLKERYTEPKLNFFQKLRMLFSKPVEVTELSFMEKHFDGFIKKSVELAQKYSK